MKADFFRFILIFLIVSTIIFSIANFVSDYRRQKQSRAGISKNLIKYVFPVIVLRNLIFVVMILGIFSRLGEDLNWTTPVMIFAFFCLLIGKALLFKKEVNLYQEGKEL